MTKYATAKILTFTVHTVPWAFFLAVCDRLPGFPFWPVFAAVLLGLGGIGWYCGRRQLIPAAVAGSSVSCLFSIVLTIHRFGVSNYTFAPFRPVDFMLFLSALLLSVQITLWRIQRKAPAQSLILQFAETLAMLFAAAVALVFLLLLLPLLWQ